MALEISQQSNDENVTILRNAEAAASRFATTDKAEGSAASWWPTLRFWSKDTIRKPSNEVPLDEVSEQSNPENTGSK
jgi:hypothetical protein